MSAPSPLVTMADESPFQPMALPSPAMILSVLAHTLYQEFQILATLPAQAITTAPVPRAAQEHIHIRLTKARTTIIAQARIRQHPESPVRYATNALAVG